MKLNERYETCQIRTVLAALIMLLVFPGSAKAHKVFVYAWVEGNKVYTESYFSGGQKVRGGLVEVFDSRGKKLLEGKTNERGEFSFKPPLKDDLRIVLTATMGHKGEYLLKAEEFGITSGSGVSNPEEIKQVTKAEKEVTLALGPDQIRKIFEQVLDSRLQPIARSIAKLREDQGPSFTEVVGGIGYIFGLMGVFLYFLSKKKIS